MIDRCFYLTAFSLVLQCASCFQPSPTTRLSLAFQHFKGIQSSSQDDCEKPYFLRKALMADLSYAAKILADGFYDDKNPASKWWEKLQTQMSLESNLPNPVLQNPHEMWVACQTGNGRVVAFCEVDNRPPKPTMPPGEVRPYMCNLAVDMEWRQQGLAQEMIRQCETSVKLWQESKLYLKVKEANKPAVNLYSKMGYEVVATQILEKTQENLLVMKREWAHDDEKEEFLTSTTILEDHRQNATDNS